MALAWGVCATAAPARDPPSVPLLTPAPPPSPPGALGHVIGVGIVLGLKGTGNL